MTTLPTGVILKIIPCSPNDDYMAGSDGQIYSRTKYAGFGRKVRTEWYPLKGSINSKGYRMISMSHNNKKVTKAVHRLICLAFHGEPGMRVETRHLDGDATNNLPSNLTWGTPTENWQDRRAHGRASTGRAKFTPQEREHIRRAISRGLCSMRHASRVLGVVPNSIQQICAEAISSGCGRLGGHTATPSPRKTP